MNANRSFTPRSRTALAAILMLVTISFPPRARAESGASPAAVSYGCPPCAGGCDDAVYDKPGTCPVCHMALVERSSLAAPPPRKNVAMLIFPGVQIVDYAAPFEVFGQAKTNVFTVAEKPDPITTAMGTRIIPRYTFETCPKVDVLVTPGGGGSRPGDGAVGDQMANPVLISWIQKTAASSELVLSVCNGAFLLARAGLLDGLEATTFHGLIEELKLAAPKTRVVRTKRYVDNGKVITSAGLTAGIDASLHVVDRLFGADRARAVALQMEYNPPTAAVARADYADQYLPDFDLPEGWQGSPVSSLGGPDDWELKYTLRSPLDARGVFDFVSSELTKKAKWDAVSKRETPGGYDSQWRFVDERHRTWNAEVVLVPAAERGTFEGTLRLKR
jgi:putative intracellular protease/amidase